MLLTGRSTWRIHSFCPFKDPFKQYKAHTRWLRTLVVFCSRQKYIEHAQHLVPNYREHDLVKFDWAPLWFGTYTQCNNVSHKMELIWSLYSLILIPLYPASPQPLPMSICNPIKIHHSQVLKPCAKPTIEPCQKSKTPPVSFPTTWITWSTLYGVQEACLARHNRALLLSYEWCICATGEVSKWSCYNMEYSLAQCFTRTHTRSNIKHQTSFLPTSNLKNERRNEIKKRRLVGSNVLAVAVPGLTILQSIACTRTRLRMLHKGFFLPFGHFGAPHRSRFDNARTQLNQTRTYICTDTVAPPAKVPETVSAIVARTKLYQLKVKKKKCDETVMKQWWNGKVTVTIWQIQNVCPSPPMIRERPPTRTEHFLPWEFEIWILRSYAKAFALWRLEKRTMRPVEAHCS